MEQKYSAFISYRHAPADIAVAKEIQRRLEHFHVPAAIRKKTGKKRIGRVFRDKEELPITSDLNQDISQALENAEYLIVICSTSTKESLWVSREIESFLKTHSKRQILTVLVDGEPYDVIPKVLLEDIVVRTAEDGASYEETVSYEPLSCDYRLSRREANREELPRLAAVLLGCGYDELVRRQRQYVVRRLTAVMSVTFTLFAAVLAYYIWSNREIRRNYMKSLENESRFLTREAEQLLSEGDAPGAALKLMEALPGGAIEGSNREQINRPLVPEAQLRLEEALNLYQSGENIDEVFDLSVRTVIHPENALYYMFPDKKGELLFGAGNGHSIYVWKAGTNRQQFRWDLSEDVRCIDERLLLGENRIIVCDTHTVYCWDIQTGELCWKTPAMGTIQKAYLDRDRQIYILTDTFLVCMDPETGEMTERFEMDFGEWKYDEFADDISPDGTRILLSLRNEGSTEYALASLNTQSGEMSILGTQEHYYRMKMPNFTMENGENAAALITSDETDVFQLRVISTKSGELLWEQSFDAYLMRSRGFTYTHATFYPLLSVFEGTADPKPYLILSLMDRVMVLDAWTGEEMLEMPLDGRAQYIWTEKGGYMIITGNGIMYQGDESSIHSSMRKTFPESMYDFCKLPGKSTCCCLVNTEVIKVYAPREGDSRYTPVGDTDQSQCDEESLRINERWAVWKKQDTLYWLDKESGAFGEKPLSEIGETIRENEESYLHEYTIRCLSEDEVLLFDQFTESIFSKVFYDIRLNLATGEFSVNPLFRSESASVQYSENADAVYLLFESNYEHMIRSYHFASEEFREVSFRLDRPSFNRKSMVLSPDAGSILMVDKDNLYLYMIDGSSGTVQASIDISYLDRKAVDELVGRYAFRLQDAWDGQLLVLPDGKSLHVYNNRGEEIAVIETNLENGDASDSLYLLPTVRISPDRNEIYCVQENILSRYDIRTGRESGRVELGDSFPDDVQWIFPDTARDLFFLQRGDDLYEIRTGDTMGISSHVSDVSMIDPADAKVYTYTYISGAELCYRWGSCPLYTLDEILQIAKETVE